VTATLVTPETLAALVAGEPAHVVIGAGRAVQHDFGIDARIGVGVEQWRKRYAGEPEFLWVNGATEFVHVERRIAIVGTASKVAIDVLEDGHTVAGHPEIVPGDVVLTLADYQALAEPVTRSGINHAPARYTLPLVLTIGVLTEVEQ